MDWNLVPNTKRLGKSDARPRRLGPLHLAFKLVTLPPFRINIIEIIPCESVTEQKEKSGSISSVDRMHKVVATELEGLLESRTLAIHLLVAVVDKRYHK